MICSFIILDRISSAGPAAGVVACVGTGGALLQCFAVGGGDAAVGIVGAAVVLLLFYRCFVAIEAAAKRPKPTAGPARSCQYWGGLRYCCCCCCCCAGGCYCCCCCCAAAAAAAGAAADVGCCCCWFYFLIIVDRISAGNRTDIRRSRRAGSRPGPPARVRSHAPSLNHFKILCIRKQSFKKKLVR